MAKLFVSLANEGLMNACAPILDWLFDENKFSDWDRVKVGRLTKRIKKLPNIGSQEYQYSSRKDLFFPKYPPRKGVRVVLAKHESESRDLIRHLRNGIAHGHSRVLYRDGNPWIELKDFNKDKQQTAYILLPVEYIDSIYKLFKEIAKQKQ